LFSFFVFLNINTQTTKALSTSQIRELRIKQFSALNTSVE